MSKMRRTYTREFKLEGLDLLEISDKSAAEIERDLGIGDGCPPPNALQPPSRGRSATSEAVA